MLSVLRGHRHARFYFSLWQYRRIFDSSWQYKQRSLSRGHIYRPIHYTTQKKSVSTPLLAESSILYAERIAWPPPLRDSTSGLWQYRRIFDSSWQYKQGVFLEAIYIGLYTIHPKNQSFRPRFLPKSSILYAERIAWPPPRNSTSLWQYRRIFDSSWQYKQRGLSRGHIYGLYTIHPKISRFDPLLAESSILYAGGVLRGRRHAILLSLWQYRRIFDSSWQYKQRESFQRPYIYIHCHTQKSVVSTPLLAEILYYMLSVLRGRRHQFYHLWQYRRIFDSSWQYKQRSLSRGHIYRPIHYTPQKSVVRPRFLPKVLYYMLSVLRGRRHAILPVVAISKNI